MTAIALAMLCSLAMSETCLAQLYTVEFNDLDGPRWTGLVDTDTNDLFIQSWTENPGGVEFWTPQSLQFLNLKTDLGNDPFDILDDWDGTIDDTWGFITFFSNSDRTWNEGNFTNLSPILGWGALINDSVIDTTGTEMVLRNVPTGPTTVADAVGEVTVTDLQTRFVPANGNLFDANNWDNGLPDGNRHAMIANGGIGTAITGGPWQIFQLTVGDIINGGDGSLTLEGVDVDVSRDLNIAGRRPTVRVIGNQTAVGDITVQNAAVFDVGSPDDGFETQIATIEAGLGQTVSATGTLSISNVTTVNLGVDVEAGEIRAINNEYGDANLTTNATISIANADAVNVRGDLELAKFTFGGSEVGANLQANGKLDLANIGTLEIANDFEVGRNGIFADFRGTAASVATATLTDVGTINIGEGVEIGRIFMNTSTTGSVSGEGEVNLSNIENLNIVQGIDIAVGVLDSFNGPITNASGDSVGALSLNNVTATISGVERCTRIGCVDDFEIPVTTATINVDGALSMTNSSLATPKLEVGLKTSETVATLSGLVALERSFINTVSLTLGKVGDLRFGVNGANRVNTNSLDLPDSYAAIDALDATLQGEIIAEFNYTPTAGTHVFDLIATTSPTALDDSSMQPMDFQVVGLNPGFTVDSFGVVEDGNDIVRLQISGTPVLLGDVNLDGVVNLLDVRPFVDLLVIGQFQIEADVNLDGIVDMTDVAPFIVILNGG